MPEFLYWAVNCKTKDCENQIYIRYVSVRDNKRRYFPPEIAPFNCRCDVCRKTYVYSQSDLIPLTTGDAPPPGFPGT